MCDKKHYDDLEERVTSLESEVAELRSETRTGFSSVNGNIETLSQMMANMDKRLVEEKQKWGEVLRKVVLWTVGTILTLALAAAGINALPDVVKAFH